MDQTAFQKLGECGTRFGQAGSGYGAAGPTGFGQAGTELAALVLNQAGLWYLMGGTELGHTTTRRGADQGWRCRTECTAC